MNDNFDNIRYYGANPQNYVRFNSELWRIIGVFNGKLKIVRNSPIGQYSWDSSTTYIGSGYGVNEWSQADAMKLLNTGYENESIGGSLYYNKKSGTCYSGQYNATTACDFTNTGLSEEAKTLISDSTWYLGGHNNHSVYPNQIYTYERGTSVINSPSDGVTRTTSWKGKIALPYPSDYGYAVDLSKCNAVLSSYSNEACTSNNWIKSLIASSSTGWLLTPNTTYSSAAIWSITSSGDVTGNNLTSDAYSLTPTLYLNSNVDIISGSGKDNDPYVIG